MKFYLHDTNAFDDEKIATLFLEHGYEGVGLFYVALEKLAAQEKPVSTRILKSQLQITKRLEKVWSFIEKLDLISTKNGDSFNERILSYAKNYEIKKEKNKIKVEQWRNNQSDKKNVTGYTSVTLPPCNSSKEEEVNRTQTTETEETASAAAVVIRYLNKVANTNHIVTDETNTLIMALLNKSYTIGDLKSVVDIKTSQWIHKDKTKVWLRPSTLFGEKFPKYIEEVKEKPAPLIQNPEGAQYGNVNI